MENTKVSDFFELKFLVSGSEKNYNNLCECNCTGCLTKIVDLPGFNLQFIMVEQAEGIIKSGSISQSEKGDDRYADNIYT